MEEKISVTINGIAETISKGRTLDWLISHSGEKDAHLIVERNGSFVYPQKYQSVFVEDGDTIEFINPDFGG